MIDLRFLSELNFQINSITLLDINGKVLMLTWCHSVRKVNIIRLNEIVDDAKLYLNNHFYTLHRYKMCYKLA